VLLALSSVILALGGAMHTAAFGRTVSAADGSNLQPFYAQALKALWLIDSATLLALAAVFAFVTIRPDPRRRPLVLILAIVPAATSILLYVFMGTFLPAHMLMVAAIAAASGGFWMQD
jgi:hypothetical protein